jgi:flagellar hook-associated protein 3 FlgL
MRIANNQYNSMMQTALNSANSQMAEINLELATGDQYTVPSQNPIATDQLSRLSRESADISQYQDNISTLKTRLSVNESYLSSISNDILSAHDLVLQAANGSNTSDDEAAIGTAVVPLMQSMLYTANSQNAEGHYLFSGTLTNTQAITYDATAAVGSRYTFTGNSEQQLVTVASGVSQPANVSLPDVATLLNQLDIAQTDMSTPGANPNDSTTSADLQNTLAALSTTLNSISGKIADTGGQQNILTTINTNFQNLSVSNQQSAVTLGQVNYADAYIELNGYQIAVQAAQKAYSDVSKLSLFNVI